MMRFWYDREGDFLEILFRDGEGYFREVREDVFERVDEQGNILGYAFFNVSRHEGQALTILLEIQQLQEVG